MLHVRDIDQTLTLLHNAVRPLASVTAVRPPDARETVSLASAVGRVLAGPVTADRDVPGFIRSQVDGLAVHAADTFGASETMPALLQFVGEIRMGQSASLDLAPGQCAYVPTGGALPAGADAMVMIEDVEDFGDSLRQILRSVSPGSHLTGAADDAAAGSVIIPAGKTLTPADLGTLAAIGQAAAIVSRRPRVAVLSTGDELVTVGNPAAPGQVYDVNTHTLTGLLQVYGAEPICRGIVRDDLDTLRQAIAAALSDCDLVLVSGGSSVGTRDHVETAINSLGPPGILQHGLAVKPGKPTIIGQCGSRLVFGLPGHPIACWFMAEWLVRPVVAWLQGTEPALRLTAQARTASRIPSNHGREEFVPVRLRRPDAKAVAPAHPAERAIPPDPANPTGLSARLAGSTNPGDPSDLVAEPVFAKSGLITLLSRSDGYIRIARDQEGLAAGTPVTVYLF